jgi:hypothetical protein
VPAPAQWLKLFMYILSIFFKYYSHRLQPSHHFINKITTALFAPDTYKYNLVMVFSFKKFTNRRFSTFRNSSNNLSAYPLNSYLKIVPNVSSDLSRYSNGQSLHGVAPLAVPPPEESMFPVSVRLHVSTFVQCIHTDCRI